jgi:glutamate-1-semialdehyde 2,1-aminomutase
MAAGCVSLDLLGTDEIERINHLGVELAKRLSDAIFERGIDGAVTNCGSLIQLHFETGGVVRGYNDTNMGSSLLTRVHRASLERGFLFAGRGLMCTSTPMTPDTIDEAATSFADGLDAVAQQLATV